MPQWVLYLSGDSLGAQEVEQEIRLAGFSPRRAPDLVRSESLLAQGEPPAAVVVDVSSVRRADLAGIRKTVEQGPLIAVNATDETIAGATATVPPKTRGMLASALEKLTS